MAKRETKTVRFVSNYQEYNANEIAGFRPDRADFLIEKGLAVEEKPAKKSSGSSSNSSSGSSNSGSQSKTSGQTSGSGKGGPGKKKTRRKKLSDK